MTSTSGAIVDDRIRQFVQKAVASAPALDPEQVRRLAGLFFPASASPALSANATDENDGTANAIRTLDGTRAISADPHERHT